MAAAAILLGVGASQVQAQDLVHRFIDPSFGGNPFYSDHLLAVANIDRPTAKPSATATPTQEDLLAQQLQARLLSQLSGDILDRIQNAAVGDTGNFAFGNQQISFTRTATETRVTFTNTTTGETNTVVLPAAGGSTGTTVTAAAARVAAAAPPLSAESALGAGGSIAALGATGRPGGSAEEALAASATTGGVLPPF